MAAVTWTGAVVVLCCWLVFLSQLPCAVCGHELYCALPLQGNGKLLFLGRNDAAEQQLQLGSSSLKHWETRLSPAAFPEGAVCSAPFFTSLLPDHVLVLAIRASCGAAFIKTQVGDCVREDECI